MSSLKLDSINVRTSESFRLADISLELMSGELVGVIGPNGSGKSTLARALAGLVSLESGEITINNRPLASISNLERAELLGYLPQNAGFSWDLTVNEAVELGQFRNAPSPSDAKDLARALADSGIQHFSHRSVHKLSGGEQMRVHIARLFYGAHDVLVADEPCASLDLKYQSQVMSLLRDYARDRIALIILHDITLAQSFCDKLVLLDNGKVVLSGRPQDVLRSPLTAEVFGLEFQDMDKIPPDASKQSILLPIFPQKMDV